MHAFAHYCLVCICLVAVCIFLHIFASSFSLLYKFSPSQIFYRNVYLKYIYLLIRFSSIVACCGSNVHKIPLTECRFVLDKTSQLYCNLDTVINLLKPTVQVMHQQFNIQQLYVLPTLYLCVLHLSENKQRLMPLTA